MKIISHHVSKVNRMFNEIGYTDKQLEDFILLAIAKGAIDEGDYICKESVDTYIRTTVPHKPTGDNI